MIIPALNEAANLPSLLREIRDQLAAASILVVDDGSTDGTQEAVQRAAASDGRIRLLERRGKPPGLTGSVLDGIRECDTPWFVVMDGDHQHPPSLLPTLASHLAGGADAAVACRRSLGGLPLLRKWLSLAANLLAVTVLLLRNQRYLADPMSGFFGGRTALFRTMAREGGFEERGYKVLLEFLRRLPPEARVEAVPFAMQPRRHGTSKLLHDEMVHSLRQQGLVGRLLATLVLPFLSRRFGRFAAVGASGIAVNLGILFALTESLGFHYLLSGALAVELSILWNFAWNDRWTWRDRRGAPWSRRLARFHQVSVGGLILNLATLYGLTSGLSLHYLASSLVGIGIAAGWNYLVNHHWTWSLGRGTVDLLALLRTHRRSLYLGALLVQVLLAALFVHDWDGFVFQETVHTFLTEGRTPYEVALEAPPYIFLTFQVPPTNTWYAYPPLPLLLLAAGYGPYLLAGVTVPALARLAWKAPILVGNLLLAPLVRSYLVARGTSRPAAERAELFLLFNPFLVLIGAVWGMFDVWVLLFLVGSLLALERHRPGLAGVAFALSVLTKPFAVFLLPPLLTTLRGRSHLLRFLGGLVAAGGAVLLPFLPVWEGMLAQAVVLHLERAPQGFAGLGVLIFLDGLSRFLRTPMDPAYLRFLGDIYGVVLLVLLAAVLGVAYALNLLGRREEDRVPGMAAALFLFLLLGKVVNEQYLVVALGFLLLLAHEARPDLAARARRAARWLSGPGTLGVLLVGFHFATFVPPDVALRLWGTDPDALVASLAAGSGLPLHVFYALASFAAFFLLLPVFLALARLSFRILKASLAEPGTEVPGFPGARTRRALVGGGLAVLLVAPILGTGLSLSPYPTTGAPDPGEIGPPRVGTFYYTWWTNPSFQTALRYGPWTNASATPAEGYYALNARHIERDLLQMREAGIDFVVVSYEGRDLERLRAVVDLAARLGLKVTVLWELGTLYRDPANEPAGPWGRTSDPALALREDTLARTAAFLASLPASILASPAWLRANGRPVFFVYDAHFASPGFATDERAFLVDAFLERADRQEVERRWGGTVSAEALLAAYPRGRAGFLGSTEEATFWRWAYYQAYVGFWEGVLTEVERRLGDAVWFGGQSWDPVRGFPHGVQAGVAGLEVFDGSFVYTPAALWPFRLWTSEEAKWRDWSNVLHRMAVHERGRGHPVVATVMPAYDDTVLRSDGFSIPARSGLTYARTWEAALAVDPDLVLITTWNEHFEGTGIEPTVEHGDRFLAMTAEWTPRLRPGVPP